MGGRGVQGVQGCLGGEGGIQGKKKLKKRKKVEKARMRWCVGGSRGSKGGCRGFRKTLRSSQQHPGFCAGGFSRPNGSGYPLSVPAVAHPLLSRCWEGERGKLNLPSVQHTTQGSADIASCHTTLCYIKGCIALYHVVVW